MVRSLPSLNALRAFEAVARLGSIARAADELHVTPAAVSQLVRQLEDYLGVSLMQRGRRLVLSEQARAALPWLSRGFDHMHLAVEHMRPRREDSTLVVTVPPEFAARWLVQRLEDFSRQFPEIELRVQPTRRLVDFTSESVDVAIRFGSGEFPCLFSELLMPESIVLVATPALAATIGAPADLPGCTLLYDDAETWDPLFPDWQQWLAAQGVSAGEMLRIRHLGTVGLVIQAATSGLGVALVWRTLVLDELRRGSLVQLFGLEMPSGRAYHLVVPEPRLAQAKVGAFRRWLRTQSDGG